MKVGVDVRILAAGTRTGVEDYTINLLSHLLPMDKSIKYRLFYSGIRKPNFDFSELKASNVKIKSLKIPNKILTLFLRLLMVPKLDRILGNVDILLNPHFLVGPVSKGIKTIVVFYDLSFIRFPNFFSLRKLFWHRFLCSKKQTQKADLIVAISESTKEDLINLYKIKPEKIKVIYPGINKKFKPIPKNDPNLLIVKKKYKLPDEFILYFGTIEPRKNIVGLIKAFEKIKKTTPQLQKNVRWKGFEGKVRGKSEKFFDFFNLKLVIAGSKGWLYDEVFKKAKDSRYAKDIVFTDFVKEEDKLYLYNLAKVFIYPSFFEGFGLPPLEAMACGIPTIVSDKSSLPEVVGQGAVMIDPHNIEEISWAIKEVLKNPDLMKYLKNQGLKKAKQFNWDRVAKEFSTLLR